MSFDFSDLIDILDGEEAGIRSAIASRSSGTPSPVFADIRKISSAGIPRMFSISAA